jgi:NTE family protein
VLVVALRPDTSQASDAALASQRVEEYGNPIFLFGKVLNAVMLDHLDTDLARMRVINELLEAGNKVYGDDFADRINEAVAPEGGASFRHIDDLVIRPSADLGVLAGQILRNLSDARVRSPLIRLAARNLSDDSRTPESDLLSYLLFDGEFLAPLAELGYADARAREDELAAFFTD